MTLKQAYFHSRRSARCVQRFDDSRSAIRITYRISLRSSSSQEPRYPLLKVVKHCDMVLRDGAGSRAPPAGVNPLTAHLHRHHHTQGLAEVASVSSWEFEKGG